MTKVFIHVGLHKTASTFLQNLVFPELQETIFLSRPYTQLNHALNKLQYADDTRFNEHEFKQEFSQFVATGKNVLLSDEMFSGVPNFNYINRSMIANRFQHLFPDATIILFLRNQRDMIRALHNSWIRNINGTNRIESFLSFPDRNYLYEQYDPIRFREVGYREFQDHKSAYYFNHDFLNLNLSNFFYFELVDLYKQLFQDVHVFLYEDFRENPAKVVSQLEAILGDRFANLQLEQLTQPINTSLSDGELEGRRFKNVGQQITDNPLLLKAFETFGKLSYSISGKQSDKDYLSDRIRDFYTDNNRKLVQTYPEIRLDKHPDQYQL